MKIPTRRHLLGVCATACVFTRPATAQTPPNGIRVLAREKSLAEQFLTLLNEFGGKNVGQYAKGVSLYAEAKAEFDGLISELEHELGTGSVAVAEVQAMNVRPNGTTSQITTARRA